MFHLPPPLPICATILFSPFLLGASHYPVLPLLPSASFTIFSQSSLCWLSQNKRSIIHFHTHTILLIISYFVEPSSKYLNYSVIQCFTLATESSSVCKLCCCIHDSPHAYFTMIKSLFFWHTSILDSFEGKSLSKVFPTASCHSLHHGTFFLSVYVANVTLVLKTCLIFSHFYFLLQRNELYRHTPKNLSYVKHEILITADI